jgi:hypothetical protein
MTIATDSELQEAINASIASQGGKERIDPRDSFGKRTYRYMKRPIFLRMGGTLGDAEWDRFAGGNAIIGFLVDDGLSEPDSERIADEALEKIAECRSRFASESGQRP